MKIKGKQYKLKKFNLKLYKMFIAASSKFDSEGLNDENIEILEDLLILAYGNVFNKDDLEEEFDIADLIEEFMNVIAEVQKNTEKRAKEMEKSIQVKFGNVI